MSLPKISVPYFSVELDTSLPSTQVLLLGTFLVLVSTLYFVVTYDRRRAKMPPYVKGWPIINQSLDHLSPHLPLLQQQWHQKYGDIYCTKSGATTFIWLSSPNVVKDLIDRRSAIYSSRPPLPLTSDVLSGGRRVAFMPRNNMWRYIEKILTLIIEL
jgi:Cytochrome P450